MKVFDAPAGIAGKDLTKVLTLAQSVIVPVLPSPIDMKAASKFIETLKKHPRIVNKKAKIALVANKGEISLIFIGSLTIFYRSKNPIFDYD